MVISKPVINVLALLLGLGAMGTEYSTLKENSCRIRHLKTSTLTMMGKEVRSYLILTVGSKDYLVFLFKSLDLTGKGLRLKVKVSPINSSPSGDRTHQRLIVSKAYW